MTHETLCKVKTIDGVQFLFMPDGTKIPYVATTRITQDCTDPGYPMAVAIVKMFVWVEDSKTADAVYSEKQETHLGD